MITDALLTPERRSMRPVEIHGLTSAEVARRRAEGKTNVRSEASSRSAWSIVRSNLVTPFNALMSAIAAVIAVVGHPIDLTFSVIVVLNTTIGIAQELRAKRTLDGLRVLIASTARVVRDGTEVEIPVGDLVPDDLLFLGMGDQVPVDATVVSCAGLEVDESSLTGEADPIAKRVDDEVLSGSAVVAGAATVVVTRVGNELWIRRLEVQAKAVDPARSELQATIDRILSWIGWGVVPLGGLLVWSQLRSGSTVREGLVAAAAGILALVPQGLVLLVSLSMATGVIRLARRHVLVRELPAVEGLARVDVICLDKTGTLTTGKLTLDAIEPLTRSADDLRVAIAALAATEPVPTSAMQLLTPVVGPAPQWGVQTVVPFSSERKWSGATFESHGTWILGAPEVLLDAMPRALTADVRTRVDTLTNDAHRVVMLAWAAPALGGSLTLPAELEPAGLVVMSEEIRPDAAATMQYFQEQGVTVKVISGDSPRTVAAVAQRVGIRGATRALDLGSHDVNMDAAVEETTVFGRVQPEQKRALVEALQRNGHTVAMTGDGVNDIPALKAADIGIAMDTAKTATKAVAELVLLDGRFDLLPGVVAEGRRIVSNMERVSSLFITKTVYATILAIAAGISQSEYPFLPRHLAIVADLTIGIPAFILGFRQSSEPCRPGYLARIGRFSVPAGLASAFATLLVFATMRSSLFDVSLEASRTAATITLASCGFWVLYRLMRPLDRPEAALLALLVIAFSGFFVISPVTRLYELHLPDWQASATAFALIVASLGLIEVLARRIERSPRFMRAVQPTMKISAEP